MEVLAISAAVIALIALLFSYSFSSWVGKVDVGTEKVKELSGFIIESAMAFLKREYKAMIPVILVLSIMIGFVINWTTAALFFGGAIFSALSGFFGLKTAVKGSERTVGAAMNEGLNQALKVAFRSGSTAGLCAAGFGLLGIGGVFVVMGTKTFSVVAGFGLGAATAALFLRLSAGIYRKGAEAGADFIIRAEAGISDRDPRNPASVASLAGSYIGNAGGTGADLFNSNAGALAASLIIAAVTRVIKPDFGYPFDLPAMEGAVFPLLISAFGVLASIAGITFVRGNQKKDPSASIKAGKYLCNAMVAIVAAVFSWIFFGNFNCAICILIGMLAGAITGKITNTYTLGGSRRLKKIAGQAQAGTLMISEYGIGMLSALWPIAVIASAILAAGGFADYYGISLAAVGMVSTIGMIASIDAFGPVSGNTKEIARMAMLSDETLNAADKLAAEGSTNTATGKGFTAAAAALTGTALFFAFATITELETVNLLKPAVIAALLFGATLPVLFSAMSMKTAGKAAASVIGDAKRQFLSDAGIMAGTTRPDYATCVDVGAKTALKGITLPSLLAFFLPPAVGIIMGLQALAGMLTGVLASGLMTAVILSNTGGAWNHTDRSNAGDPFKDAAGAAVNVFMILMTTVALVFAPVLVKIGSIL